MEDTGKRHSAVRVQGRGCDPAGSGCSGATFPPTPYPPSAQDLCVKDRVKVIAASGVSTQVPALLALKEDLGLGVQS